MEQGMCQINVQHQEIMMKLNATEFQFVLKLHVLAKVMNIRSRETVSSKVSIIHPFRAQHTETSSLCGLRDCVNLLINESAKELQGPLMLRDYLVDGL